MTECVVLRAAAPYPIGECIRALTSVGTRDVIIVFFFTSTRLIGPLAVTHGEDFVQKWEQKLLHLVDHARAKGVKLEELGKGGKKVAALEV